MKQKLMSLLLFAVIVGSVAIGFRLRTIYSTQSSSEPMNQELLPDTYFRNAKRKIQKHMIEQMKERTGELQMAIDDAEKLTEELEKKSQPPQSEEVLLLRGEMDNFSSRVDEIKKLLQQLQEQPNPLQNRVMDELTIKMSLFSTELSEIQSRIKELEKETLAPDAAPPAP